MLDLSRMLGRFEGGYDQQFAGRPQQQMMRERWDNNFMGGQGIRDLIGNRLRDRLRDRFGGQKRHNDPVAPTPVQMQPEQEPMDQGDPYGNPFTPTGVSLGSMLTRRPIY